MSFTRGSSTGTQRLRVISPSSAIPSEVFFGIGSLETDAGRRLEALNLPTDHPAKPPTTHLDMVDDLRRFVAHLASRTDPTLKIGSVVVADEFHATVPGIVLSRALRAYHTPDDGED